MKKFGRPLSGCLITIITTLLGLLLGLGVFLVSDFFHQRGSWQELDAPPGLLLRLATATDRHVIIEASDGMFYKVYCHAEYPGDRCWEKTVPPPQNPYPVSCDEYRFPSPPGPARDLIAFCNQHEYISLTQYALLEDGGLWRWEVTVNPLGQVASLFWSAVLGVIVGAIVGVYLWLAGA